MTVEYMIKQLSIFVNNEPGRLAYIASVLKECGINLKAFNIAESDGFGVFRAIVDDPDRAFSELRRRNVVVKETEVLAVPMADEPGGLFEVARVIGDAGINIEYGYAFTGRSCSAFFFRVDGPEKAAEAIRAAGLHILKECEL